MKNVPSVYDSRLLFAEWFKRVSWLAFDLMFKITLYEHWIVMEQHNHCCEWMSDSDIASGKDKQGRLVVVQGHLIFADSDIKKILNQLRKYEI